MKLSLSEFCRLSAVHFLILIFLLAEHGKYPLLRHGRQDELHPRCNHMKLRLLRVVSNPKARIKAVIGIL